MSSTLLQPLSVDQNPANYWRLPVAPDERLLLTPAEIGLALEVRRDPNRLGFSGEPQAADRLRVAAAYTIERHDNQLGQRILQALKDGNLHDGASATTRLSLLHERFRHTRLSDLERLSFNALIGNIQRRASNLSSAQVAWEKTHGTLGLGALEAMGISGDVDAHFDFCNITLTAGRITRRMMRGGWLRRRSQRFDTISPASLAERLELPDLIAGPTVSSLVSFGVLERNTAGDELRATPHMNL